MNLVVKSIPSSAAMSPSLSPIPDPRQDPAPVLVPVSKPQSDRRKWLLLIPLAIVMVLAAAGWTWRQRQHPEAQTVIAARTARVIRGVLARTIRLTGTV